MRLLLVDDHEVVRSGLRMLLESQEDIQIVGEAGNAAEAFEALEQLGPDVILLDISLPDISGIQVMERIREIQPELAVVALTIHEDKEYFFRMLEAGAIGYVPKRAAPEELLTAVRAAAQGQVYLYPSLATLLVKDYLVQDAEARDARMLDGLTERELEVLTQVADGATNAEIGNALGISPKTVARHRENIMAKLNLHSRTELVKYAIRKGIIKP
ncbi:MAG: response regulator transcription factor [Anaerolineae bacterium]|nr:MAG: response regulator transcription factor [Anaerolineae bacterium]